ncbi:MAG: hypothetical protein M1839_009604 [Geoglossum umbratile]|nr:MAG: hypothetical protein M1839_009604 [Geoglossum umbratile]
MAMESPLGSALSDANVGARWRRPSGGGVGAGQRLRTDLEGFEDFENDSADDELWSDSGDDCGLKSVIPATNIGGDELFTFGNNQNGTLGFSDIDNRQHPERVTIRRPDHLLRRFWREHQDQRSIALCNLALEVPQETETFIPRDLSSLPSLIRNRSLAIRDIALSKLHTAILTTDPESNLYMCGFGPGGRLGTGDETTRFNFVCIDGGGLAGKQIVAVGLGQGHTLAIDSEGDIFSWGTNTYSQLGYSVPPGGQEPVQTVPRQIFGPLKRELVIGAAASRWHSVVHTSTSLFTFGKNEGQLGLVDSGARSLEIQTTPRRVGASQFSCSIKMVSAIDRATVCLLDNYEVWIFENFGFLKMSFPLEGRPNYSLKRATPATRYSTSQNRITKIASGGDTICAMSSMDVFTITIQQKLERGSNASTTNPTKIRNALSQPKRIWSSRKNHTAVRDVGVGQDGSVIICTHLGSVWRQVERVKIKNTNALSAVNNRPNDYKFSRVPGLTKIAAVRSNAFGAYAAVRRDCDVPKTQITVDRPKLWDDLAPLLPFHSLVVSLRENHDAIKSFLSSPELEKDVSGTFPKLAYEGDLAYDVGVCSSVSDVTIPAHSFMLAARSPILRAAFSEFRQSGSSSISELVSISREQLGVTRVRLQGVDFLSILNIVLCVYTDTLIDVWNYTRHMPNLAFRFRQIRNEMMRVASCLELHSLERSVRVMVKPTRVLHTDMERAIMDPSFFDDGDIIIELADSEVAVHSALMCQRCPFFKALFKGRAAGGWLSSRRERAADASGVIKIDMRHVDSVVFRLVLRHVYADTGEELFDDVVIEDLDEFIDLVVDVMSIANELMLDRLSQISQKMLGRFVTTRNALQLLNAVAPCSVTRFKDAVLEYLCLNLEAMLDNHLLDELDEDLQLELDQVVHNKYPDLVAMLDHERQAKVDSSHAHSRTQGEEESRYSNPLKTKVGGTDDLSSPPMSQKSHRKPPREVKSFSTSSVLRSKASGMDLMFDMDDGEELLGTKENSKGEPRPGAPVPRGIGDQGHATSLPKGSAWSSTKGKALSPQQQIAEELPPQSAVSTTSKSNPTPPPKPLSLALPDFPGSPTPVRRWEVNPLPSAKLSMREILEQASASRTSNISLGLSSQTRLEKAPRGKMSQKERKKQQHQGVQPDPPGQSAATLEKPAVAGKPTSPWQSPIKGPKVSLRDILGESGRREKSSMTSPHLQIPSVPHSKPETASTASSHYAPPKEPPSQHHHSPATATITPRATVTTTPSLTTLAEPPLQLSLSEIISQQQREQEIIRGTVLKRSLTEIQQEQEFQSWWEAESARVRGENEAEAVRARFGERRGRGRGRRRGAGRGRGDRGSKTWGVIG